MVKLQTIVTRRIGEKEYLKNIVTVPQNLIEELGWKQNQELDFQRLNNNKLLLMPAQPRLKANKSAFETFSKTVNKVLKRAPQGLTYSQIRAITGLPYKRLNPLWVHRLEKERGLVRIKDSKSSRVVWKLG